MSLHGLGQVQPCFGKRVPQYVCTLNGRRMRVNERRPPLMKALGDFTKRWKPSGWIWQPVPQSSSVSICFSKRGNFVYVCRRLICVHFVSVGRCLKPASRALNLKSMSSNVMIVAASIRDILIRAAT